MADNSVLWGTLADTSTQYDASATTRKVSSTLGKDDFLQLLMTQMKYQDPLSPMDNKDSVAQLAQFSALEQMQQVSASSQKSQAFSLVGKIVSGTYANEVSGVTELLDGRVTKVSIKNGEPYLMVGDKEIALTKLEGVYDSGETEYQLEGLNMVNSNIATLQSISLIGKTVQAVTTDSDGNLQEFIEGKVDYLKTIDNRLQLVIGTKEVSLESVLTVSDNSLIKGKQITLKSGDETVTDEIKSIDITNGTMFVNLNTVTAPVSNMSDLIKALSYVGSEINLSSGKGTVDGVTLSDSKLYVNIGDDLVSLDTVYNYNK